MARTAGPADGLRADVRRVTVNLDTGRPHGSEFPLKMTLGLAAPRMTALVTCRSKDSLQNRFGRKFQVSRSAALVRFRLAALGTTPKFPLPLSTPIRFPPRPAPTRIHQSVPTTSPRPNHTPPCVSLTPSPINL